MTACHYIFSSYYNYSVAMIDPERPGEELNPCLVNATVFARRARCHLRCLFRRSEDQCFMCNRTCNGMFTVLTGVPLLLRNTRKCYCFVN